MERIGAMDDDDRAIARIALDSAHRHQPAFRCRSLSVLHDLDVAGGVAMAHRQAQVQRHNAGRFQQGVQGPEGVAFRLRFLGLLRQLESCVLEHVAGEEEASPRGGPPAADEASGPPEDVSRPDYWKVGSGSTSPQANQSQSSLVSPSSQQQARALYQKTKSQSGTGTPELLKSRSNTGNSGSVRSESIQQVAASAGLGHSKPSRRELRVVVDGFVPDAGRVQRRCNFTILRESIISSVIVLNCLLIGVSRDFHPDWIGWLVLYAAFTAVFTAECVIKIHMSRRDYFCGPGWRWNLFDLALAIFGIVDVLFSAFTSSGGSSSQSTIFGWLRYVRVARLLRLGQLLRTNLGKELLLMVQGTKAGLHVLGWASVFVLVPIYATAIFYRETIGEFSADGSGAEMFSSVAGASFTLFRCVVVSDCSDDSGRPIFHLVAMHYGWGYGFVYAALFMFLVFGLFNVVAAIFIEKVLTTADREKKRREREHLADLGHFVRCGKKILEIAFRTYNGLDAREPLSTDWYSEASNLRYPVHIVQGALATPQAQELLIDLSIAEEDLRHIAMIMDIDGDGTVDADELLGTLATLRGSVSRCDVVALSFKVETLLERLVSEPPSNIGSSEELMTI